MVLNIVGILLVGMCLLEVLSMVHPWWFFLISNPWPKGNLFALGQTKEGGVIFSLSFYSFYLIIAWQNVPNNYSSNKRLFFLFNLPLLPSGI